ncbi:glycosyltransferase family 4 protein [Acinetobacter sp. GFQ9D192M]|uniref:glycosyltransferase family 4 protein n=1 Tax=unclassified Acinetobacter TaxID=196816 RepID=UPI00140B7D13|nr:MULTISPECIES: glycosyltransferase family 4 protein [unclassified Acinetobacter]NHB65483.1 glycosyltransferase family 4 protein [Acinetobacter sp. GFQ9D191M]NHB99374.1 glycosyltransferase family 4 protein [Acinetobacter sp. GFQ9D192M]
MACIAFIGTVASSFYGFRADLIRTLLKKGHQVYAFTSEYTAEDLKKIEKLGATPITYTLNRGGLNPLADTIATYQLSKKIKAINPDLVFSYFSKPVIFGTLAAKLAKAPRVVGMLEGLGYTFTEQPKGLSKKTQLIKKIQVFLYKIALPQLDQLIFLNPDDPKDLLEKYAINVKKVEVLGGIGLNLQDYPYQPLSNIHLPLKFLFIGRLLKEKGIHEFVQAAKLVKKIYPDTEFTVLGAIDHHNLGALQQTELDSLISSNIIQYPGHVSNIKDWIADSHVFVLPSYREGVPRSTQEAMATGRAIITTDVPGCRETVINTKNGFIVPKWNPEALAEKMIYFIENPEKTQVMGAESYKIAVEKFDAEKVNQRLVNILGL